MPYTAVLLVFAGLIPFIGLLIAPLLGWLDLLTAARYFTQYSAVLLSFFGGVHWLDALQNRRNNHQLYIAMLPTLIGWLCLVFSSDSRALGVLSAAYVFTLIYDKFVLALPKSLIMTYTAVRMAATTGVVVCHAILIFWLS